MIAIDFMTTSTFCKVKLVVIVTTTVQTDVIIGRSALCVTFNVLTYFCCGSKSSAHDSAKLQHRKYTVLSWIQWTLVITMSDISKYCLLWYLFNTPITSKQLKLSTGYIDSLDILILFSCPSSIVITRVYCIKPIQTKNLINMQVPTIDRQSLIGCPIYW